MGRKSRKAAAIRITNKSKGGSVSISEHGGAWVLKRITESEEGAAIKVVRLKLSPAAKESLKTGVDRLENIR
jgi:hypothetical protein